MFGYHLSVHNISRKHDYCVHSEFLISAMYKNDYSNNITYSIYCILHSADVLKRLVLESVPFVQKHITRCLLAKGRKKVLDNMVQDVLDKFGVDRVAKFIHGCSPDVVLKITKEHPDILESEELDWFRCCKFQPKLIVREVVEQVKKYADDYDGQGSTSWDFKCLARNHGNKNGWTELLKHPSSMGITESLLNLAYDYPRIEFDGYYHDTSDEKKAIKRWQESKELNVGHFIQIPDLFWKHQVLFWTRHRELMMKIVQKSLNYDQYARLKFNLNYGHKASEEIWWKQNDELSVQQKKKPALKESFIELMQYLLDKSPKEVVFPLDVEGKLCCIVMIF